MGEPNAVESVNPVTTTDKAKPRGEGGTSIAADPVVVGENMAAPTKAANLLR